MVMAIILFMGAVSGAHLNPAVSLAFALRGDFPWRRVPGYIIVQLLGATLACLFLLAVFGNVGHLGATLPGPGYENWQALLMEIVLTAGLVSVILGTASAAQNVGAIAALGVGGYIALAGLWSAPVSGASMNPARSFGPALVGTDFSSYWVYVVGPLAGAMIAVGFAYVLRGPGGDPISRAAGSGALTPGALSPRRGLPATSTPVGSCRPGQPSAMTHSRSRALDHAFTPVGCPAGMAGLRPVNANPDRWRTSRGSNGGSTELWLARPGRAARPSCSPRHRPR